jgi:excisionase family DNA binding protein
MQLDPLLTPEEVSALLGVPVATLYRWRYTGYGAQAIKIGKHLRWQQSTVEAWLAAQEKAG